MSKNIYMVIGANYGDEGKGQTVNFLAKKHNPNETIVVCTNGSSQRGHTVIYNGKRHIFHHFGSGTIHGAHTFFSKDFILNPLMFHKEDMDLHKEKIDKPRCFAHKDCKVAFPYDMFVNQIVELSRKNKHGSCGCGVWETLKRYESNRCFTIGELSKMDNLSLTKYIKSCRDISYARAKQLVQEESLDTTILKEYKKLFKSDSIAETILITLNHFFNVVQIVNDSSYLNKYETVIFENGQGLLLDKRVDKKLSTPSITGCETMLTSLNDGFYIGHIVPSLYYVTRPYITRHGSTNFKEKCEKEEINDAIIDETNQPNPFQGTLMYGKLNYEELCERVQNDAQRMPIKVEYGFAVTHTDEYNWENDRVTIGDFIIDICKEEKMVEFNAKKVKENIVEWIRNWFEQNGKNCNAVIGLSGGKDSNIMAALCVEALGKERVIGVTMPNIVQTDNDVLTNDLKDVKELVDCLGIELFTIPINAAYCHTIANIQKELGATDAVSEQTKINLAPRLRMATLYAISQSVNGRVANTCNLSEEYVGWSTRWGDNVGDFAPLANLTVTELLEIGKELLIPYHLISKTPADGLCGKTDEDKFGFSYKVLDKYIRTGECENDETKKKIDAMHQKNLFKLNPIPSFKLM